MRRIQIPRRMEPLRKTRGLGGVVRNRMLPAVLARLKELYEERGAMELERRKRRANREKELKMKKGEDRDMQKNHKLGHSNGKLGFRKHNPYNLHNTGLEEPKRPESLIKRRDKATPTAAPATSQKKTPAETKETQKASNKSWLGEIKKFALYGAVGYGLGRIVGHAHSAYGMLGSVAVATGIGVSMALVPRLLGKKGKQAGNMGLAMTLEMIAGDGVFISALCTAGIFASLVKEPLSGMAAGGAITLVGYLVHTTCFYGSWGVVNLKKYRNTGFGNINDLKKFPKEIFNTVKGIIDTVRRIIDREPISKENKAEAETAESFLSEFADLHAKGIVWGSPYHALRIAAGFFAGFTPDTFVASFVAIYMAFSPYIFPIYINFYRAIEQRINSVVKVKEQSLKQ